MKEVYLQLFEQNWTLTDIDEMDFFYWLDLSIYKTTKESKRQTVYIDQVF